MGGVVANAEVPLDQHGYALRGPQVVGPAVSDGTLLTEDCAGKDLLAASFLPNTRYETQRNCR
jgi:hypothetical protein